MKILLETFRPVLYYHRCQGATSLTEEILLCNEYNLSYKAGTLFTVWLCELALSSHQKVNSQIHKEKGGELDQEQYLESVNPQC